MQRYRQCMDTILVTDDWMTAASHFSNGYWYFAGLHPDNWHARLRPIVRRANEMFARRPSNPLALPPQHQRSYTMFSTVTATYDDDSILALPSVENDPLLMDILRNVASIGAQDRFAAARTRRERALPLSLAPPASEGQSAEE